MCKLVTNYVDCEHENKLGKMPRYSTLSNYSLTLRGRFAGNVIWPFPNVVLEAINSKLLSKFDLLSAI